MTPSHGFSAAGIRLAASLLGSSVLLIAAVGCETKEPDAHVWGSVTYNGTPLTTGFIVLTPLSPKANSYGVGPLDEMGRFIVQSSRSDIDMIPGRYSITIRPPNVSSTWRAGVDAAPGYGVAKKYLDPDHPVVFVELKAEPLKLDVSLGD